MARWLTVAAWLFAWYAGVVVIILNIAATVVQYAQHHTVIMFANSLSIFSVQINFTDAPYARSGWNGYDASWTWDLYLNAICSGAQSEDADSIDFRDCHEDIGKTFYLQEQILSVESSWYSAQTAEAASQNSMLSSYYATHIDSSTTSHVFSYLPPPLTARQAATDGTAVTVIATNPTPATTLPTSILVSTVTAEGTVQSSETSTPTTASQTYASVPTAVPTAASSHVTQISINFISPFVFYLIGLVDAGVLWFTIPGTFHGKRHLNFLNTCISVSSFLALLIASASSTAIARSSISRLSTTASEPYVLYARTSRDFLALTWSATSVMLLATVLLAMEWTMERFTPTGETISRHWKPAGMSWFKQTRGNMRLPRERPVQLRSTGMGLMELERTRQRQLELRSEPEMGHLSNVEQWMNRLDGEQDVVSVRRLD